MKDLDEKIRKALASESHLRTDVAGGEESVFLMLGELLRGRSRWMNMLVMFFQLVTFAFAIACAVLFFRVESTQDHILYAVLFMWGMTASGFLKLWFWLVMNRNSVLREVKRLEFQIAALAEKLEVH